MIGDGRTVGLDMEGRGSTLIPFDEIQSFKVRTLTSYDSLRNWRLWDTSSKFPKKWKLVGMSNFCNDGRIPIFIWLYFLELPDFANYTRPSFEWNTCNSSKSHEAWLLWRVTDHKTFRDQWTLTQREFQSITVNVTKFQHFQSKKVAANTIHPQWSEVTLPTCLRCFGFFFSFKLTMWSLILKYA